MELEFLVHEILNDAEHIRGTECDQRILSKGRSNGTVFSPCYPFPYLPKVVCRYFIYGLQDAQNLERVRLQFLETFDIPEIPDAKTNCSDGFLRLYLQGQETKRKYDSPDYELCGKTLPDPVKSFGPRLLMVFSSGSSQGIGFKANYKFETEYQIPGTASPDGRCLFTYFSSSHKSGTFNSPRHPANYPSNTTCEFSFRPRSDEQVQVVFDQFKVRSDDTNHTFGNHCMEDFVEIYNIYKVKGTDNEIQKINGRYCGQAIPGPVQNERNSIGLRVILRTDHEGVYSGFDANYLFKKKQPFFNGLKSQLLNLNFKLTGLGNIKFLFIHFISSIVNQENQFRLHDMIFILKGKK
ncbi:Facilitated trehalose transporter Tret1 [Armadillidium vulgare]|nr:Facilitated trehalose transporter Tret1 [Armadillidium vulgare]